MFRSSKFNFELKLLFSFGYLDLESDLDCKF